MANNLNDDQIFLRKLTEIVHANLGNENFGAKELARESGMSQQSLNLRLQSIINKPINQFIRETRLQKALEMLQNGNVTASEVAYKVGFSSPAYFNTCFNEFFGFPPGKVKKSGLENSKQLNSVQVPVKQEKTRIARRTLKIISSGILILATIVCLVYYFFLRTYFTETLNTVKDIDGNVYHVIKIGSQVWMKEDLKTTRYNDGTAIPYVAGDKEWAALRSDAYCWYNNDESYKSVYGALYNWYTVNRGNICPTGWHVSSNSDWEELIDFCGGWDVAGGKLKEAGTAHWEAPHFGATNETGFTALPAGGRGREGWFYGIGHFDGWWCPPKCGDVRGLASDRIWIYFTETYASEAYSVRCVKNDK